MVVLGADVAGKTDADKFVAAVADAFYAVSDAIDGPDGDEITVALGEKFSELELDAMKTALTQTVFYKTPADAKALLDGDEFKEKMKAVTAFCESHELVKSPSVGYGADAGEVNLRFDSSYLK